VTGLTRAKEKKSMPDSVNAPQHPSGYDLLRDPRLNRGTAFSAAERRARGLEGLLPPAVTTIELQVARRHAEIANLDDDLHEVAKPKDALAISDDDEAHVSFRPIAKQLLQTAPRIDWQINAASLAKNVTELLACLADRRRIDKRHVGGRIRHQERVKQGLVARLQV
jgi:hypothetical protein